MRTWQCPVFTPVVFAVVPVTVVFALRYTLYVVEVYWFVWDTTPGRSRAAAMKRSHEAATSGERQRLPSAASARARAVGELMVLLAHSNSKRPVLPAAHGWRAAGHTRPDAYPIESAPRGVARTCGGAVLRCCPARWAGVSVLRWWRHFSSVRRQPPPAPPT